MLKVVNKAWRFILNISVQPVTRDLKQYDKPRQKAALELGKTSKSSLFIFSRYTKKKPMESIKVSRNKSVLQDHKMQRQNVKPIVSWRTLLKCLKIIP